MDIFIDSFLGPDVRGEENGIRRGEGESPRRALVLWSPRRSRAGNNDDGDAFSSLLSRSKLATSLNASIESFERLSSPRRRTTNSIVRYHVDIGGGDRIHGWRYSTDRESPCRR